MLYERALEILYSRPKVNQNRCESTKRLLSRFKIPHMKCIHIAGTNGKGSVASYVASGLKDYNTGLFTSPFLFDFTERIKVNNECISRDEVCRLLKTVLEKADNQGFFEILVVIAMLYFAQKNVDYAVIETGIGGRDDATNTIDAFLSVITSINLDHTERLGSLEDIGIIKSGIIKHKGIVSRQAYPFIKTDRPLIVAETCDYKAKAKFQNQNISLAYAVLKELGLDSLDIENTYIPGRFDLKGRFIFDCAHNPSAAKALAKELSGKVTLVFGAMKDKDIAGMVKYLKPLCSEVVLTRVDYERAESLCVLKEYFGCGVCFENVKDALEYAKSKDNPILVTGSVYLVGQAMSIEGYGGCSAKPD